MGDGAQGRQWRWDGNSWTWWDGQSWVVGEPAPGEVGDPSHTAQSGPVTSPAAGRSGLGGAAIAGIVVAAVLGVMLIGGGALLVVSRFLGGNDVVELTPGTASSAVEQATPSTTSPTPSEVATSSAPPTPAPTPTVPAPAPPPPVGESGRENDAISLAASRLDQCQIQVLGSGTEYLPVLEDPDLSFGAQPTGQGAGLYRVEMYVSSGDVYAWTVNVDTAAVTAADEGSAGLELECPGVFN